MFEFSGVAYVYVVNRVRLELACASSYFDPSPEGCTDQTYNQEYEPKNLSVPKNFHSREKDLIA